MKEVFGVDGLNPETEINHVIGSKSALAMIPTAFINPGDMTIMPTPNYPILGTHTKYLGGRSCPFTAFGGKFFSSKIGFIVPSYIEKV